MTPNQSISDDGRAIAQQLGETFARSARVETIFGQPVVQDSCSVVPVARARWGFGGGQKASGEGSGQGGGGGLRVDPMGIVVLRGGDAEFRPIRRISPLVVLGIGIAAGLLISRRRKA